MPTAPASASRCEPILPTRFDVNTPPWAGARNARRRAGWIAVIAAPKVAMSCSISAGMTPVRTRRQISPTPLAGKGGSKRNASPRPRHAARPAHCRGSGRRAIPQERAAAPPPAAVCSLPSLPASTMTPPSAKLATPMLERPLSRQQRRVALRIERQVVQRAQAPPRRRARSACREPRPAWRGSLPRRPADAAHGCRGVSPSWRDAPQRGRFRGPVTIASPDRDSVTTVSARTKASQGCRSGRPPPPLGSRKPEAEMKASGHSCGNGIRHLPPGGCIMCIAGSFRCPVVR